MVEEGTSGGEEGLMLWGARADWSLVDVETWSIKGVCWREEGAVDTGG